MAAFVDESGKVDEQVFKSELFPYTGAASQRVIQGPQFGVDTAIIDLGNGLAMATSSDPLSWIPSMGAKASAWLSVHLLANDMSTTGHAPQFAQFVLNLPTAMGLSAFQDYWRHIHELCEQMGVAITGGHTGQIEGQNSTIAGGGTMFLTAPRDQILSSNGAQPGDSIILTKSMALSSTAILAMAFPESVSRHCGTEAQQQAESNFWNLSVLKEARLAAQTLGIHKGLHAMHDVTEGGVLGAIAEMAGASKCGVDLLGEALPLKPEVGAVARLFEIDPRLSIGAGAMAMAVKSGCEAQLIKALEQEGIPSAVVGKFTPQQGVYRITEADGRQSEFSVEGKDPYWGAFFKALEAGWK